MTELRLEETDMPIKKLMKCLLMLIAAFVVSVPGHAAMVPTTELQASQVAIDFGSIETKRDWIREQLVIGGVETADAARRVAALTDDQVLEIHQRIDEHPAGGNGTLIIIFLLLVIAELTGIIDVIPNWPAD